MNLSRDINIKPSFLRELHALPTNMGEQVWEKINFLAQNPIPDGHLKKKLNKWEDVYRLRVGDFRLFYSFGGNWIRLLSIRPRKNAYQGNVNYEEPTNLGNDTDIIIDEEIASGVSGAFSYVEYSEQKALPMVLTEEWLRQLGIPNDYHDKFLSCRSEDDLLLAEVPEVYLERVIENIFPRPVNEILQQPDLVVLDTNDLLRYKEGDLLGFLLKLDSDQERLVDWALQGPALIKGGPGTGKSTIALYRVRSLLDNLNKQGKNNIKILFTTYTPALMRFSQQLLDQLLGGRTDRVKVDTADDIAIRIVSLNEEVGQIIDRNQMRIYAEEAVRNIKRDHILHKYRVEYLLDEIEWVIEGQNLKGLDEYFVANRSGRGTALSKQVREEVWECYKKFQEILKRKGLSTISAIRCRALELVTTNKYKERYDAVLIDEAQDLTPTSLALLTELSANKSGVYLTADASQSIYYRGFAWSEIHENLKFRGRAVNLRRNYRTTREISEAAASFLRTTESGERESLTVRSVQNGPKPLLMSYQSDDDQCQFIIKFIKQMSRHLRLKASSAAILVPTATVGKQLAEGVTAAGLPCKFVRGSQLDLKSDEVKVMTLASSKGLEFPLVCLAQLDKSFPKFVGMTDEDIDEELKVARRTIYVGMTRAMRGLLVLYNKKHPNRFINEFDLSYWEA